MAKCDDFEELGFKGLSDEETDGQGRVTTFQVLKNDFINGNKQYCS